MNAEAAGTSTSDAATDRDVGADGADAAGVPAEAPVAPSPALHASLRELDDVLEGTWTITGRVTGSQGRSSAAPPRAGRQRRFVLWSSLSTSMCCSRTCPETAWVSVTVSVTDHLGTG